jgi:hypothetical protein
MLSRRTILIAAVIAGALGLSPAFAASPQPFNAEAFAEVPDLQGADTNLGPTDG